jgi:hypothetical protein
LRFVVEEHSDYGDEEEEKEEAAHYIGWAGHFCGGEGAGGRPGGLVEA